MSDRALIVDLDGTLVDTDMLHELAVKSFKETPWRALQWPVALLRGKAYLKQVISESTDFDAALLPYNQELLPWLKQQAETGRELVLCTAADQKIAEKIAQHVGIFTNVMASDGSNNLSGQNKAAALVARYGEGNFDYCGNASIDLKVWQFAGNAIAVNATAELLQQAGDITSVAHRFCSPRSAQAQWARMASTYRWPVKALLFLLATLASAIFFSVTPAVYGFACLFFLSLLLPIGYDLLALDRHRSSDSQMSSVFASGETPLWVGVAVIALTLPASLICAYYALTI